MQQAIPYKCIGTLRDRQADARWNKFTIEPLRLRKIWKTTLIPGEHRIWISDQDWLMGGKQLGFGDYEPSTAKSMLDARSVWQRWTQWCHGSPWSI